MYESRSHDKIGTNGYGPVMQNWTDSLGYWLSSKKLISFAQEVMKTKGGRIENKEVIDAVEGWGLTDEKGNIRQWLPSGRGQAWRPEMTGEAYSSWKEKRT